MNAARGRAWRGGVAIRRRLIDTLAGVQLARHTGDEDIPQFHAEALRNLAAQDAAVETLEQHGATVVIEAELAAPSVRAERAELMHLPASRGSQLTRSAPRFACRRPGAALISLH